MPHRRLSNVPVLVIAMVLASACATGLQSEPTGGNRTTVEVSSQAGDVATPSSPPVDGLTGTESSAEPRPPAPYTPATEGIGPGPPCPADASCAAQFAFDGNLYDLSCGALDPAWVDPVPLAQGDEPGLDFAVHAVREVDPAVLVAVRPLHCEGPLDLGPEGFHTALNREQAFTASGLSEAYNDALCRAALYGTDPAEGFDCDQAD